jgi:hypothetical protein
MCFYYNNIYDITISVFTIIIAMILQYVFYYNNIYDITICVFTIIIAMILQLVFLL